MRVASCRRDFGGRDLVGRQAQPWPTRPITLISPYPPGGTNDIVRTSVCGQDRNQIAAADRGREPAGAAGIVGSLAASRAAPDGYTLLIANNGALVVQPLVSAQAKYDVQTNFTPIARYWPCLIPISV